MFLFLLGLPKVETSLFFCLSFRFRALFPFHLVLLLLQLQGLLRLGTNALRLHLLFGLAKLPFRAPLGLQNGRCLYRLTEL